MALNQPPIQEKTTEQNGRFPLVWLRWFQSIAFDSEDGFSGSFTNGDGNTVTVVNGKITDIS